MSAYGGSIYTNAIVSFNESKHLFLNSKTSMVSASSNIQRRSQFLCRTHTVEVFALTDELQRESH